MDALGDLETVCSSEEIAAVGYAGGRVRSGYGEGGGARAGYRTADVDPSTAWLARL